MKKKIYVIDWYTSRFFSLTHAPENMKLKIGDKIAYNIQDADGKVKTSVGKYVGSHYTIDKEAKFRNVLQGKEKNFFDKQQEFALKIFPIFKKKFRKSFPGSIPVTARFHTYSDQLYLYFYSEERYIFTEFVKDFRSKIGKNIFLFQVGARDMMRMDPNADNLQCGTQEIPMYCKTNSLLPSIEIENIGLQNLEGRDIERLKGRCGKLRCDLIFEMDLYTQEVKKYPLKGSQVKYKDVEGIVNSFNIMTGDVSIKTKEGGLIRIPVDLVKPKKT